MVIFGPKPRVNSFAKMSIFRLFELLVFIEQKRVFSFWNIVKDIFLAYIPLKQRIQKWPFLDLNHALTPLKKSKFSDFLASCFNSLERRFFVVEYRKTYFPGLYCLKKKVGKMAIFGPKPWVTPLEKCQFFDFLNFSFLQPRKAFFRSKIQ